MGTAQRPCFTSFPLPRRLRCVHYVAGIVDTRQLSRNPLHPTRLLPQCRRSIFRPGQLAAPRSSVAFSASSRPTGLLRPDLRRPRDPRRLRQLRDRSTTANDHQRHHEPCFADWAVACSAANRPPSTSRSHRRPPAIWITLATVDLPLVQLTEAVHLCPLPDDYQKRHRRASAVTFCRPRIVHPDQRQVLPLAPEFVRNSGSHTADGGNYRKQDCEITAG